MLHFSKIGQSAVELWRFNRLLFRRCLDLTGKGFWPLCRHSLPMYRYLRRWSAAEIYGPNTKFHNGGRWRLSSIFISELDTWPPPRTITYKVCRSVSKADDLVVQLWSPSVLLVMKPVSQSVTSSWSSEYPPDASRRPRLLQLCYFFSGRLISETAERTSVKSISYVSF